MNDGDRPNPDALLAALRRDEAWQGRGRLKVFLGMCPGVGKTYAMLEAAHRELKHGRDVVVGCVETHGRDETYALLAGLTLISRKQIEYRGVKLAEMNIDAILARRPRLALVDELAHTNAPGSRHPKRWQDVNELLDAGIDVFTTVNIQHIESRADTVRQITSVEIRETVPDSILDDAEIELIDLPTDELLQRLKEGKVYLGERATAAAQNFFREANLTALRELVLRLVADHVGEETLEFHRTQAGGGAWKTGHRLLVAVSASPLSESLIRWTRRMADGLKCPWLAVHVESSGQLDEAAKARLEINLELARSLGAEVIATTDEDLVRGILRVAQQRNVSQIVVGKPSITGFRAAQLLRRLTRESGNIDLHVVRAEKTDAAAAKPRWHWQPHSSLNQYVVAFAAVASTSGVNALLAPFTGPRVLGLVLLLTVVLLALFLGRGPVFLAGTLSALVWDYFFLPPRFTFHIHSAEDGILFALYFVVAIVLGQLVARIRAQEIAERLREERATALYQLTHELAQAGTRDEVAWQLLAETNRVFRAPVAVVLPGNRGLFAHPDGSFALSEKEFNVAEWAFRNRKAAGRFTDTLPGADALHLPLATERAVVGVLSVNLPDKTLTLAQRDLLEAFARQAALVLDRVALRAAAEESKLVAESERLGKTLLNSVSHELRTPLAAICTAVSGLCAAGPLTAAQKSLCSELDEAANRLNRLVQNLLDLSRLEAGHLQPELDWHDLRDVLADSLKTLGRTLAGHELKIDFPDDLPPVKLDAALTEQIFVNLLGNATTHTPAGSTIEIRAQIQDEWLVLKVADNGPGLPPGDPARLFDRFRRGPQAAAGGTGLGLSLVKGFAAAQGGTVAAANRPEGGAIFTVKLPSFKVPPVPEETE